jgi:hypothetical protein
MYVNTVGGLYDNGAVGVALEAASNNNISYNLIVDAQAHPALRSARQFHPQGQYRASPRTACRGTAAGDCRSAGTTRLAPAVSLLRRPHDHHRDLRAMAPTTRATSCADVNRERSVVTRHGLHTPHVAKSPLRRMLQDAPFARTSATGLNVGCGQLPIHCPSGGEAHSPGHQQRRRRARFATTSTEQNSISP